MDNKQSKKYSRIRFCTLLLAVVMVVALTPIMAMADEDELVEYVEYYELELSRSDGKFEYYELSADGIVREEKVQTDSDGNITVFLYGENPGDVTVSVAVKSSSEEEIEAEVWWLFDLRVHDDLRISKVFKEVELDLAETVMFSDPRLKDLVDASMISVVLNGEPIHFFSAPIIIKGRTLAPFGDLFEALGIAADWEGTLLTGVRNETKLTLHGYSLTRNDEHLYLDVPMQEVAGRTYVPVRAVAECFGFTVDWDGPTQTVILTE